MIGHSETCKREYLLKDQLGEMNLHIAISGDTLTLKGITPPPCCNSIITPPETPNYPFLGPPGTPNYPFLGPGLDLLTRLPIPLDVECDNNVLIMWREFVNR